MSSLSPEPTPIAKEGQLTILYRDEHLLAIHKPSGLLVHRTALDFHESRFAVQILRDQIGQRVFPVHRLDKGTSGVLLFALDLDTARHLSRQFEHQSIGKSYLAVVRGWPPEQGLIDHALTRRPDEMEFQDARAAHLTQSAQTRFRRLDTVELPFRVDRYPTSRYALVALEPLTGRRHQLRRHLKHLSHPIIGDATYGKGRHNRFFQAQFGIERLLLACRSLVVQHPHTQQILRLTAPLEGQYAALLTRLGWQLPT